MRSVFGRLGWGMVAALGLVAAGAALGERSTIGPVTLQAQDCARHYVAGGDHCPAGHDIEEAERYPNHLLEDHLKTWGPWCVYDIAKNETTSATYITGGQLAQTWNLRPDLITLTVGEENTTIIKLVTECFDDVKDHDFAGATTCASAILGNASLWTNLTLNLTTILQQYRVILAGRPALMVAVTGYPNPYPKSLTATEKIAELCPPLMDTATTCTLRWVQLPPALEVIDQVFQKLNKTIADSVAPFTTGSLGRIIFVDTYDKTRDHCMKMEVEFKTTVEHPEEMGAVHEHDSPEKVNF